MTKKKIRIKDKSFEIFLPEEQIQTAIRQVAGDINKDYADRDPVFICILNGAFMFGADLFKEIDFPCQISFVKMASYVGTESSGKIRYLIGLNENENLYDRDVIIVEDIVDTGKTLMSILPQIVEKKPRKIEVATLLFKPDAYTTDYPIKYRGLDIPNDFIVGYGLDYDGYGRNLRDIYVLSEEE